MSASRFEIIRTVPASAAKQSFHRAVCFPKASPWERGRESADGAASLTSETNPVT